MMIYRIISDKLHKILQSMNFDIAIQSYSEQPLTKQFLLDMLKEYKRPYDKINELVKQDLLIPVKRGIYMPGANLKMAPPEKILLANHLYGPSYVSLETALSHWGMIPERVFETSSVTTNISKTFKTAVGRFSYKHLPLPYYSFGIQQVQLTKRQTVLMATAEKAVCDKIITTSGIILRSAKQTVALLVEDFRIDLQSLKNLDITVINKWVKNAPKENSIMILIKTLKSL